MNIYFSGPLETFISTCALVLPAFAVWQKKDSSISSTARPSSRVRPRPPHQDVYEGFRFEQGHGFLGTPVQSVEELRRGFAENVKAGADFLKFFVTGTSCRRGNAAS